MKTLIGLLMGAFVILVTSTGYAQQNVLSKKDTSEVRFVNSRKFWIYKVEKGETMFSISQKFKIPQEEIREFNPDIETNGLKAKMKLWIPAYSWINKKSATNKEAEITDDERMLSSRRFRILFLTSLNLSKVYTNHDESDSSFVNERLPLEIKENLEFLEGSLIGAKKFSDKTHEMELIIHDTEGDSSKIKRIFSKPDMISVDLIITNESGSSLRMINNFSANHHIQLFSAAINSTDIIRNNEFAYALSPSSLMQCQLMGRTASKLFKNTNLLLLKTGISREDERVLAFKEGWMGIYHNTPIKNVNFSKGYTLAVKDSMQKSKLNVLFVPSSNEDIISTLLSSLRDLSVDYSLAVVGLPTWLYSQSIDPVLFNTCNTYLFSAGYVNYSENNVIEFRKAFRDHYHTEPMDAAYIGYDAVQIAYEKYFQVGKKKLKDPGKNAIKGIYSSYQFKESEAGNCRENQVIQLYQFKEAVPVYIKVDSGD